MIRIITDSLCDFTMDYAKENNFDIMPLTVRFGETDYKCGVDLTNEAFYDLLENSEDAPSTAAVNPYEFEETFQRRDRSHYFFQKHECYFPVCQDCR